MNESRGTLKTAMLLRVAYMECQGMNRQGADINFRSYCQSAFDMDEFTAGLFYEVIDAVGSLGVTPDSSHPIVDPLGSRQGGLY